MAESPMFGRQRDSYPAAGKNIPRSISAFNPLDRTSTGNDDLFKLLEDLHDQLNHQEKENLLLRSSNEFGITLANVTDKNLAVHQAILRLQYTLKCGLAAYFHHDRKNQRLELFFPFGPEMSRLRDKLGERWERYWHSLTGGLIGKAIRSGKVQASAEQDPSLELLYTGSRPFISLMAAPVLSRGSLEGVILLADTRQNFFDSIDTSFTNDVCTHFSAALGRISYTELEQTVVHATTRMVELHEPREILHQLAELTVETTGARMAIAAVFDETDWWIEAAGTIDQRLIKDHNGLNTFFRFIINQKGPFPLQDLRSNDAALKLDIEDDALKSLLACPFFLSDYVSAQEGVLLALGKSSGSHFTAVDEMLIQNLANNAALALDYALTKNDLRANAEKNQRALNLSLDIARSSKLSEAARRILLDVKNQFAADTAGLILVDEAGQTLVQLGLPDDLTEEDLDGNEGMRIDHPRDQIDEAIRSGEQIVVPLGDSIKKIYPIKTQERCYGVMWLEIPIRGARKVHRDEDIRSLINQTAVALESSIRNARVQTAYQELNQTYSALTDTHARLEQSHNQLSETFKQTILSLMSALEAREKETAEHNKRMEKIATKIGKCLDLNREDSENLSYGSLMHDIGKIGVSDSILLKKDKLTAAEREIMEKHSLTGAEFIQDIPGLKGASEIIAGHHELWNGSGYPYGLSGRMIPLLARIVTVADVYDALTNDRPYREKLSSEQAVEYLKNQAGILYDPEIVDILLRVIPALTQEEPVLAL
jgi:HD-GYP domain-containing protein (c-di-GMP phosphodiesterase class II)